MILPDCSRGVYRPFRITAKEKRALVRKLSENGVSGIEEFLREEGNEGAIRDRMEEIRERISKQIEEVKAKRMRGLESEIGELQSSARTVMEEAKDGLLEDETAYRKYASGEIKGEIHAMDIISVLEGREETEDLVRKESLIRRFLAFLKKVWRSIISMLGRVVGFFKRLLGRGKHKRERTSGEAKGAISLPFPSIGKEVKYWEEKIDRDLSENRHLQSAVDKRLEERYGYSTGIIEFKKSSDPEWYRQEAKKVLREEVEEKAETASEKLERMKRERMKRRERSQSKRRDLEDRILKRRRDLELEEEKLESTKERMTMEEMKSELVRSLAFMGYIRREDEGIDPDELKGWEVTEALIEKFSELLYTDLQREASGRREMKGGAVSNSGVYEKHRLRTVFEEPRMDMLTSIVNARVNHPGDRTIDPGDMIVYREVKTSDVHAVILVDVSGSMEENMRLEAAKRAVLALTSALRRDNPRNKVDIVSVSTRARAIGLKEVMEMEPRGFTNLSEGVAIARSLFESSRSDRHILFLITDGLPEAYTPAGKEPIAGDLEEAMHRTLTEVKGLMRIPDLSFNIFLLEPEDEKFVESARRIAREGSGRVMVADPSKLAEKMLGYYRSFGEMIPGI